MERISHQFANIFIHYYSNRVSSACKLFISEPTQNQERLLGRLFGILEINTPSRENSQLINNIIGNLEDIYYSYAENENLDPAQCFENTLKEVNQKFIQFIREKQVSLVGNLNEDTIREKINLAIGIIIDGQIQVSYLNNINIFLVHKAKQDFKLIDIKKIAQEDEANGNKENASLFGNIISGAVNAPDFLVLANANFLEYVSPERLQKIITSLPLHKAAEYFKNSLLQFEGQNFAAIFIKNLQTESAAAKEPASLTSITELNYTESATEKLLAPSFWNIIKGLPSKIAKFASKFTIDHSPKPRFPLEEIPAEKTRESQIIKTKTDSRLSNLWQKFKKATKNFWTNNILIAKIKNKLALRLTIWRNKMRTVPNYSKALLSIAAVLLILFAFSIIYFKHQQSQAISQKNYQNLIAQIQDRSNEAESDLIYGNEDKAKAVIAEAQALLATLPVQSQKQKEAQQALDKQIQAMVAKLRHITVIDNPTLVADLSIQQAGDIQNIVRQNNLIIAFDSSNNANFQINPDGPKITKYASNLTDIGSIEIVKLISDKILAYQNKNGFLQYNSNGQYSLFTVTLPANAQVADFADYTSKLYLTDKNSSQIYRLPQTDQGYGPGLPWLKSAQDLKNVVSMAIDTNIWLLGSDGQIMKFTKGNKQAFEIKGLDPALESPTRLFTDDQTSYLYILEPKNKRIVVLDKSGKMAAQYYSDTFNNLKDFAVDEKDKKIYLANDNKIYSFVLSNLK